MQVTPGRNCLTNSPCKFISARAIGLSGMPHWVLMIAATVQPVPGD